LAKNKYEASNKRRFFRHLTAKDEKGGKSNANPRPLAGAKSKKRRHRRIWCAAHTPSFTKLTPGPDGHFIAWVVPGTAYYLVYHRTGPDNPIEMKKDLRVEQGQFLDQGAITVRSGTTQAR
jgi:hypothetical protein